MELKRIHLVITTILFFTLNGLLATIAQAQTKGTPGSIAANFAAPDLNGKTLTLKDFRGKYILLDFWASWCVPCRKGSPHIIELYRKYASRNFDVIGIADDDTRPQQWRAAIKQDSTGIWHHILRGSATGKTHLKMANTNDLHLLYGIHSLPIKILIGPNGKVIGRYGDDETNDKDLDKALVAAFNY